MVVGWLFFDMETTDNESTWSMYETTASPDKEVSAQPFLGVLLILLSVISILGNVATIWAFKSNPKLRHNHSNLLILGLSCFDLVIGWTGLPTAAIQTGFGIWPLGREVCVISVLLSVVGVSGAMYTLAAINIDRYLLVSKEYAVYLRIQSSRNLKLQLTGSLLLACFIASSETIIWVAGGTRDVEVLIDFTKECRSPVRTDPKFAIITSVLVFALPFLIMIISNLRFVVLLRRRLRRRHKSSVLGNSAKPKAIETNDKTNTVSQTENGLPGDPEEIEPMTSNTNLGETENSRQHAPVRPQSHTPVQKEKSSEPKKQRSKMKNRYMKAAVRLAILMSVFGFCSLPYPIFVLIADTKCSDCVVVLARSHLSNLLLANSALNPFVYAIMHRQIRQFYSTKFNSIFCRRKQYI